MEIEMPDLTHSAHALAALGNVRHRLCIRHRGGIHPSAEIQTRDGGRGRSLALVALAWQKSGLQGGDEVLRHNLIEYAELLLFLLAAMTFVNTLEERHVFVALRSPLVAHSFSLPRDVLADRCDGLRLSPILDNLTTALVMGAVVLAAARGNAAFITPACINIVVAANAGGAFSPFGDITTLMVWQKGLVALPDSSRSSSLRS